MLGFKPKQLIITLLIATLLFSTLSSIFWFTRQECLGIDYCAVQIGFPLPFAGRVTSLGLQLSSSPADYSWHYRWILLVVDILILWVVTLAVWKGLRINKTITITIITVIILLYIALPYIIGYFANIPRTPNAGQQKMIENRMQYINNLKK